MASVALSAPAVPPDTGASTNAMLAAPRISATLRAAAMPMVAVAPPVTALAFSPDGKTLAVGTYKEVQIWDPETRRLVRTLTGHADAVHTLAFTKDGKWLAAGSGWVWANGPSHPRVSIWELSSGTRKHLFEIQGNHAMRSVGFSADSKTVFAVRSGAGGIHSWSLPDGKELPNVSLEGIPRGIEAPRLTWSADSRFVLGSVPNKVSHHAPCNVMIVRTT